MEFIKKIYNFFNDGTPYFASSLSFFTIFSIFPLMALLIVIISYSSFFSQYVGDIMSYIFDFINPTHSQELSSFIATFLENTNKLGNIGIYYLMFVFTMFFKDYEYVVNKIHNSKPRAIYKLFFLYLGFLIIIPILFAIFILISNLTNNDFFMIKILAFLFIWGIFIILFQISTSKKLKIKAILISSLITLIVLSISKSLFGYYVTSNTTYTTIYGSFSIALFFFLWIYLSWSIYLYGLKLCALIDKGDLKNEN